MTTNPRSGTLALITLVTLTVVMALGASLLTGTLQSHRQLRRERDVRQADLLVRAGLARATQQLAKSREYEGETWEFSGAEITIKLAGDDSRRAEVNVTWPGIHPQPIRRSAEFLLPTGE
jgi:type II secretory pathway component PulK